MNYTQDANELAKDYERREHRVTARGESPSPIRGTLTIWPSFRGMQDGDGFIVKSLNTHIDLTKPGLVIAYDDEMDAEVFAIVPGWYIQYEPNREGE